MIQERSNLAKLLTWIHNKMTFNYDFFIVITGDEGVGKSRGMFLNIMDYWYKVLLKKPVPSNCFGVDVGDFIKSLNEGEPMDFRGLDEAGDVLDSQEFSNKFNKMLYQAYTVIREKKYFTVIVLPNYFELNPRFRKRRVRLLINIKKRYDNTCKKCKTKFVGGVCPKCGSESFRKGYIVWEAFNRWGIRQILNRNENRGLKSLKVGVKPIASGIVQGEYSGELSDVYSKMKTDKMNTLLKQLHEDIGSFKGTKDNKNKKKVCKHAWLYYKRSNVWRCRLCGKEVKINPFE